MRFVRMLAALLVVGGVAQAQTADSVIALNVAARGGLARLRAVRSARLVGTASFGPREVGVDTVEIERPMRIRTTIHMGHNLIVQGSDGSTAWDGMGRGDTLRYRALNGTQEMNVKAGADLDGPLVDYAAKGVLVRYAGVDTADGRPAFVLEVTRSTGEHELYYIDRATHLETKWSRGVTIAGHPSLIESYFRDYRPVNGVMFAFQIVSDDGRPVPTARLTFTSVELNADIDPDRFRMPK